MEADEFILFTGALLSMELSKEAKEYHELVLLKELIHKNRIEAEKRGIGIESRLTPRTEDTESITAFRKIIHLFPS